MYTFIKTNSDNSDFIELVRQLDVYLKEKDGEEHSFYAQFNKIDKINQAIVVYENEIPVSCAAIKKYDAETMEVKRMFTSPVCRGKGIATLLLQELENWAKEMNYTRCILETGKRQPEAIALYQKNNYKQIPNYGQYQGVENSVCFEKTL